MTPARTRFLIIGSGPTGLGAALRLQELKEEDYVIVERENYAGGLATSFEDEKGFTWDIGGHVQFSHYNAFDRLMDQALGKDGWLHHQRESWAWMMSRFVPYPVQNNIRYFPKDKMWESLEGIIKLYKNPPTEKPENFQDWLKATFGEGLCQAFMFPYNFKVWAYPPSELAFQWIGERVATVDLSRVTENILFEKDDLSWGPNHTFRFPKQGGTGSIWKALASALPQEKILFRHEVVELDLDKKEARLQTDSGEKTIRYEEILSTMPLDLLCERIRPSLPQSALDASRGLVHSTSNIVGVGLKGSPPEHLRTKCWMYFPEDNCPFYRVTVFSNYSPGNVPDIKNYWSLMSETSESPSKPVDSETLVEQTLRGMLNTRLIESLDQVESTWTYRAAHGYPTPSLKRDEALQKLLPELDGLGISSRGRFGAWKYEVSNQDHSAMQGWEWAERVVLGTPETTAFFPDVANSGWGRQSTK